MQRLTLDEMWECARRVVEATRGIEDRRTRERHDVAAAMMRVIHERGEKCRKQS